MILRKYLPEIVYGGIDGIVTTFAIVAGVMGAELSASMVFVLGFSSVIADGWSMGSSAYLAAESEHDPAERQSKRESLKEAVMTFVSFVILGSIPLIPFLIGVITPMDTNKLFIASIVLTGVMFIGVGWGRGRLLKKSRIKAAVQTLLIGGVAAGVAYVLGMLLSGLV